MKHIVLISCVKRKGPARTKARDLYESDLFRKCMAFAQSLAPEAIYILSAKHGLLALDEEIEPYDETLNKMPSRDVKAWAARVVAQLRSVTDLDADRFTVLASERYRKHLLPSLVRHEVPLKGLGIGQQLAYLKREVAAGDVKITSGAATEDRAESASISTTISDASAAAEVAATCDRLHRWLIGLPRHHFPFDALAIPTNGIYVLFEAGEYGHGGDRVVRVGTHNGQGQLRSRLKQHFLLENKDRSIFRKNIGRALLERARDPFIATWELDLTTSEAKASHENVVDRERLRQVEIEVTAYMRKSFSFAVLDMPKKEDRLRLESRLISTFSSCSACGPSTSWLGLASPKEKIRKSGMWQVNELWKQPIANTDLGSLGCG